MATNQVLTSTGISYTPASASTAGSLQSLAYDKTNNQLIAAADANSVSSTFAVNTTSLNFPLIQSNTRSFFSDFDATLGDENTVELEVNAASDTEDVVYVVNNYNDDSEVEPDEVTVYKLIPNPSVTGNWQISAFKIPPQPGPSPNAVINPEAAVVIEGTIYFGGGARDANKTRNITSYDFDANTYAASPAFTFYAVAGTLEGLSYDGTYLYGLVRNATGGVDVVEQWLWNTSDPTLSTLVQVYDLYDVPEFATLRNNSAGDNDGSWKPHALEKTPSGLYIGNNSRNIDGVIAEAYSTTLPSNLGLSPDIRFLATFQERRNTRTNQPEIQKGIQIAEMEDSKNLPETPPQNPGDSFYSSKGATLDGTTRFALYGTNMLQTTGGWSMAVTVTANEVLDSDSVNRGVIAIQYTNSGSTTNSYLRINSVDAEGNAAWRFRWNGKSIDSSEANGPKNGKEQRLFLEYDQSTGNLYLSAIDINNPTITIIASDSVSALSPTNIATKLSIGDKDTSGTPTPSNGGWVGSIKDFVIYETFMDLKSGVEEPSFTINNQRQGTYFYPSITQGIVGARAKNPNAAWQNGVNPNGCNNAGIGINIDGGSLPDTENGIGYNWTLNTQIDNFFASGTVAPRTPQGSSPLSCSANVVRTGNVETTWDESQPLYSFAGAASSGGTALKTSIVSPVFVAKNPENVNGAPVSGAGPIEAGKADLNSLITGWESDSSS